MSDPAPATHPLQRHSKWRAAAAFSAIAVLAAALYSLAHDVILDPIIDVGRDIYIAERIAAGARLYRDLRYNYPPLAPTLLALIVRLAGPSLAVLQAFNLAVAALTAAALYRLAGVSSGRRAALVALFLFVALSFTGATTWNASFLVPYATATTLGILFVLLFGIAAVRMLNASGPGVAASLIVFATLACWTKHEDALAAAGTFAAAAVLHRPFRKPFAVFVVANALLFALASSYYASPVPGHHWIHDNILNSSLTSSDAARSFNALVSGRGALLRNVALLVVSAALSIALFALLRRFDRASSRPARIGLALTIVAIELLLSPILFRGAPLLLAVVALILLRRDRNSPLLLLSLLALLSLARIPLDASAGWYGFALIVPTYAMAGAIVSEQRGWQLRTAILALPLFLFAGAIGVMQQSYVYASATNIVTTPRGSFRDPLPDRALVVNDLVEWCERSHRRSLVVFPEGVTLNFLTGLRTPLSYYLFTPVETADPAIEDRILAELERSRPELVALVSRDVSEYGSRGFGLDYDQRIMKYIHDHYVEAHHIERPSFGAVVMQRSDLR